MTIALNHHATAPDRVACQATGQAVMPEETVRFQGQLVSATGKQVLIDRIRAGESMTGHLEKPGLSRRIAAIALDLLLLLMVDVLIRLTIVGGMPWTFNSGNATEFGLIIMFESAAWVGYFTLLHGGRGQSLGKMAGRLRVVTADGGKLTFSQAALRAAACWGPGFIVGLSLLPGAGPLSTIVSVAAVTYLLANAITAALDRRQRALHDLLARTRVVHVETPPVAAPLALACPGCGAEMALGPGQTVYRCQCGWAGEVYTFAPYAPPIPPVEGAGPDDAGCAYHPGKRAIAICAGSGDYVCSICAAELAGKPFGIQYLEAAGKLDLLRAFDRYLPRPDNLVFTICAGALSIFGLFMITAMVLGASGNPALIEALGPIGLITMAVSFSSVIWVPLLWFRVIGAYRLAKRNALFGRVTGSARSVIGVVLLVMMSFVAAGAGIGLVIAVIGIISHWGGP